MNYGFISGIDGWCENNLKQERRITMTNRTAGEPWLLTPGPLTTAPETKGAMLQDWGSRDRHFIDTVADIRKRLLAMAGADESYDCVIMQGSGTFAIEAALSSFVPRRGRALVVINGAYGHRAAKILEILGRDYVSLDMGETVAPLGADVAAALENDPAITDVFVVHCETTTGILNPLADIARAVKTAGRRLIIDSMSAFGALPLETDTIPFDVMVSSANKCIEGVPGFAFAIARKEWLEGAKGRSHSLSLDLHAQWAGLNTNGQFRFTPPTHALMAFHRALKLHEAEGGVIGRGRRYWGNFRVLVDGMRAMGFKTLLGDDWMAPIIVTFLQPADPNFDMDRFYDEIRARGFAIYPGKLTVAETFRIGCIGQLDVEVMKAALDAIREALGVMGVKNGAPAS